MKNEWLQVNCITMEYPICVLLDRNTINTIYRKEECK